MNLIERLRELEAKARAEDPILFGNSVYTGEFVDMLVDNWPKLLAVVEEARKLPASEWDLMNALAALEDPC